MKRVVQFKETPEGYACIENDKIIFEVPKEKLEFDVKAFYDAFYGEDKDYENIELQECEKTKNKTAKHVYACITQLIKKIEEKMHEIPEEVDEEVAIEEK
ncbi:MAG: hypothetical protein J6X80_07240 [Lachnospiraceae bacterium]|nr:hypothetical protein [Lachnospiraceae bacterium]